ncbi:hypothetical protein [Gemmatimonas sp.]|uniref:hypothetical protein n=1 Tax=Gemmatimonas sp. TaxID=1962908 RepID=UPI00391F7167
MALLSNPSIMHRFRVRQRASAAAVFLSALTLGACTDTASLARADSLAAALASATAERDSLQGLVAGSVAEKDRALAQVVEASKFADQVDAELRLVRGISSKVGVNTSDESGKTEAAAAQKDILDRLTQMRQRLNARQAQVRALLDTLRTMRADSTAAATLLADLNSRLEQRDKEIAVFQEEIRSLRTANEQLTAEKAVLTDTVKAMEVRENRVCYVVGTRRQLLSDGVVTEEGGSRGLLIVKLGKTLVPARSLNEARFTRADRREVLTIPLPRNDRPYRIVSRHDAGLIEAAKKEKDGSFRGENIRITDPAKFWAASRYLIITEK